jgi:Fe-S cluster biogenesis protein NfuA
VQEEINEVIGKINTLLAGDGSRLTLIRAGGNSISVRFSLGNASDCESCAIDPETAEMLVREAIQTNLPAITQIEIISERPKE